MIDQNRLKSEFALRYGGEPRIFRAPGRVNLIGEHTDYNDGFVLPCAIDFANYVAASPRNDRRIRVGSLNFEEDLEFDLDDTAKPPAANWTKYVQGVALSLEAAGYRLQGADILIDSDIPIGAGLSSSAALEVSAAFALGSLSGHEIEGMSLAKIGQAAEHKYAGVLSGIMDQFASVFGREGHALFLDCRSLEWSAVPVSSAQFVICNTKTKHDLAEGEYNKRRAECEEAARLFGQKSLRGVTADEFRTGAVGMPEVLIKRARHIISENQRVLDAVAALNRGDLPAFGSLMNGSHESLRSAYEVSSPELDLMVDLARVQPGVIGARMTGGGFGGCTINLVEIDDLAYFTKKISAAYYRQTGIVPEIYMCRTSDGVSELHDTLEL